MFSKVEPLHVSIGDIAQSSGEGLLVHVVAKPCDEENDIGDEITQVSEEWLLARDLSGSGPMWIRPAKEKVAGSLGCRIVAVWALLVQ